MYIKSNYILRRFAVKNRHNCFREFFETKQYSSALWVRQYVIDDLGNRTYKGTRKKDGWRQINNKEWLEIKNNKNCFEVRV